GSTLVTLGTDRALRLWDTATGEERPAIKATSPVAFSPDGKLLATGGPDKTVRLWDTATWKERSAIKAPLASVLSLAFAPASVAQPPTLAIGGGERSNHEGTPFIKDVGEVKLWDLDADKARASLKAPGGMVSRLLFAPDGKTLAGVSGTLLNPPE